MKTQALSLLQSALGKFNLELRRKRKEQNERFQIDVLDLLLRGTETYCIVIGAYDGDTNDPMCRLIKRYQFPALLIEPNPLVFPRLQNNFRNYPEVSCRNAAYGAKEGHQLFYRFVQHENLPDHAKQLTSVYKDHLLCNGHGYKGEIEAFYAPIITAEDISYHIRNRSYAVQIDTEGSDYWILTELLSSYVVGARVIRFENNFMKPWQYKELCETLIRKNYQLLTLGIDTLAYNPSL